MMHASVWDGAEAVRAIMGALASALRPPSSWNAKRNFAPLDNRNYEHDEKFNCLVEEII